jgi:hypothetical protein
MCGDVVLCGGSHLAATGVRPTEAMPVLLARRLRRRGCHAQLELLFLERGPLDLIDNEQLRGRTGYQLMLIPRNVVDMPLPHHLTMLGARLRGKRVTLEDLGRRATEAEYPTSASTPGPRRRPALRPRIRRRLRWLAALGLATAGLLVLPLTLTRYGRRLDAAVAWALDNGCTRVVLATPVPLSWRDYPGVSWHQHAVAWLVRRRAGGRVVVADAYARLGKLPRAGREQPGDPLHLRPEGLRELAGVLEQALTEA